MKFNPAREVEYRVQLAREYLEDAENRFGSNDHKGCVQYSQLAAENSAKAVIATRRTPTWGHDPSAELFQIASQLGSELAGKATKLAELSSQLAPEHGRTTYGEPDQFKTPRMLYDLNSANRAIANAREAIEIMNQILAALEK